MDIDSTNFQYKHQAVIGACERTEHYCSHFVICLDVYPPLELGREVDVVCLHQELDTLDCIVPATQVQDVLGTALPTHLSCHTNHLPVH